MSVVVQLICDKTVPYGVCATPSPPASTVEDCIERADELGWLYRPARNGAPAEVLCPHHAGTRP